MYIRKRIDVETFNNLTLTLMEEEKRREEEAKKKRDGGDSGREDGTGTSHPTGDTGKEEKEKEDDSFIDEQGNLHSGSLKIDATCCEVEVKYPADLDVLNDAREVSESLINNLLHH